MVVQITAGGCNVLNTLLHGPRHLSAVDENPAQTCLLSLKIASLQSLSYEDFWLFWGVGQSAQIPDQLYHQVRPFLSLAAAAYWDRNIGLFRQGLYRQGALGTLILLRRCLEALCGQQLLTAFASAHTKAQQQYLYDTMLRPYLWNPVTTYLPTLTMVLYGVSARQIGRLLYHGQWWLGQLFSSRIEQIFRELPIWKNYFWQRILTGRYPDTTICPAYLRPASFPVLKKNLGQLSLHTCDIISFLRNLSPHTVSVFNLSDVPEFLSGRRRHELWHEVCRTAQPGARIIYRSVAPGLWIDQYQFPSLQYQQSVSTFLSRKDMTGSYAQVYVYRCEPAAEEGKNPARRKRTNWKRPSIQ